MWLEYASKLPVNLQLQATLRSATSFRWLGQLNSDTAPHHPSWSLEKAGGPCFPSPSHLNLIAGVTARTLWSQGVSEIISHEVDEENCNHRLDRTKLLGLGQSVPYQNAWLWDFRTFFFLILSI